MKITPITDTVECACGRHVIPVVDTERRWWCPSCGHRMPAGQPDPVLPMDRPVTFVDLQRIVAQVVQEGSNPMYTEGLLTILHRAIVDVGNRS